MRRLILWFGIWLVFTLAWAGFLDGLLVYLEQRGVIPGLGYFAIFFWLLVVSGMLLFLWIAIAIEHRRNARLRAMRQRQRRH